MPRLIDIVDFDEPAARDEFGVGLAVLLFGDVHAPLSHAHGLGQEIKSPIVAVEHQFHGSLLRCELQSDKSPEFKTCRVAEKGRLAAVGMGEQCEMLVFGHSEQRKTAFEFDFIGFFLERPVPSVVSTTSYFQGERVVGRTDGLVAVDAHRVEVESSVHIVGFRLDGTGRIDENDGQRTGITHGSRCRKCHVQEQKQKKMLRPDCFHRFFDCHTHQFGAKLGIFRLISILCVVFDDEGYGVSRNSLFATCETEAFGGGGFDGNLTSGNAHHFGHCLLHLRNMRIEFRTLGADGGIDVADFVAVFA